MSELFSSAKRDVKANRSTNIVKVTLGAPICQDTRASMERKSSGFKAVQNRTGLSFQHFYLGQKW